jgi:hypothetical protein
VTIGLLVTDRLTNDRFGSRAAPSTVLPARPVRLNFAPSLRIFCLAAYYFGMSKNHLDDLHDLVVRLTELPEEAQHEIVQSLRDIEARYHGIYVATKDDRAALTRLRNQASSITDLRHKPLDPRECVRSDRLSAHQDLDLTRPVWCTARVRPRKVQSRFRTGRVTVAVTRSPPNCRWNKSASFRFAKHHIAKSDATVSCRSCVLIR